MLKRFLHWPQQNMGGQERRVANIGRVAREEEGGGGATRKMLTTFISHNLLVREALEGSMVVHVWHVGLKLPPCIRWGLDTTLKLFFKKYPLFPSSFKSVLPVHTSPPPCLYQSYYDSLKRCHLEHLWNSTSAPHCSHFLWPLCERECFFSCSEWSTRAPSRLICHL